MIRVLLVDDHPVVRAGYQRLLEQAGDIRVVGQAGDVDGGLAAFTALANDTTTSGGAPDVTVTDLQMPGSGGLELVRRLRERRADARVLVFSMHDSELLVRRAFELGARGFVPKSSPPDELVDALRAVHAGQRVLGTGLPARLLEPATSPATLIDALTPREFEIFRLLARGETLLDCGRVLHLSAKTVSNHQTQIKDKLGVTTSAALVHLAIRHGVISAGGE